MSAINMLKTVAITKLTDILPNNVSASPPIKKLMLEAMTEAFNIGKAQSTHGTIGINDVNGVPLRVGDKVTRSDYYGELTIKYINTDEYGDPVAAYGLCDDHEVVYWTFVGVELVK